MRCWMRVALLVLLPLPGCGGGGGYGSPPPPPNATGQVQFSTATYFADENASTVVITATRTGGSAGEILASADLEDDTAIHDLDYTPVSATLDWPDGDATDKTFSITVSDNAFATGNRTVRMSLSSADAPIGNPGEALLVIRDDEMSSSIAFTNAFPQLTFAAPVYVVQAPGDAAHLYVVERAGLIRVVDKDAAATTSTVFLDVSDRVSTDGECGLLGLAFDPNFASNGFFYVNYAGGNPLTTHIARFHATSATTADVSSEQTVLSYAQPFTNHKGGWLGFGPDGKLYVAAGDGGSGNDPNGNGQSLNTLLGKILRINTDGSAPADNPFANDGDANTLAEIWAYGLRNPWRDSFDRLTGDLWTGDVGQNAWEEIDVITAGKNYGWKICEGHVCSAAPPANYQAPVYDYPQSGGSASVTGGYRYRGSAAPAAAGKYFYADFIHGTVFTLDYDGANASNNTQVSAVPHPDSFGEDLDGELYVVSYDGKIYRLIQP